MVLLDSLLLLLILGGIGVGLYFLIEALKKKKSSGPAGEPSSQNLLGASPELPSSSPSSSLPACPEGQARSFNLVTAKYDGECSPIVEGCLEGKACNYARKVNVHRQEMCDLPNYHIEEDCNKECISGYIKDNYGKCVYALPSTE